MITRLSQLGIPDFESAGRSAGSVVTGAPVLIEASC